MSNVYFTSCEYCFINKSINTFFQSTFVHFSVPKMIVILLLLLLLLLCALVYVARKTIQPLIPKCEEIVYGYIIIVYIYIWIEKSK